MNPEEIKKMFSDGLKAFGDTVKQGIADALTPVEKKIDGIDTSVKGLETRVAKIEALPIAEKAVNVNLLPTKHRGVEIERQGGRLIELAQGKSGFKVFNDESKMYEFKKWMIDVTKALVFKDMDAMSVLQKAAMAEGAGATGGYIVPVAYEMEMIRLVREASFALQFCNVFQMGTNLAYLPSEASLVSVSWTDEAGSITKSNPTVGQVAMAVKKLAGLTDPVSNELIADSSFDIVSMLTEQFAYATVQELDNQVLNGTGNPCSGVLTAKAGFSVVTSGANFSSVTAINFRSMIRKLSAVDSAVAKFVYGKDVSFYADTLVDSTGRFLVREPSGIKPAQLWNRDIYESAKAPTEADSGTGKGFAVLGNWKQFYIGQRAGLATIAVDPYGAFATDATSFRMTSRWALNVARASAFCRAITGS